jgi:hypothetical protein
MGWMTALAYPKGLRTHTPLHAQAASLVLLPEVIPDLGNGCVAYFQAIPNLGLIYVAQLSQIYPKSIPFFSGKQAIPFPKFGIDLGMARFTSAGSAAGCHPGRYERGTASTRPPHAAQHDGPIERPRRPMGPETLDTRPSCSCCCHRPRQPRSSTLHAPMLKA